MSHLVILAKFAALEILAHEVHFPFPEVAPLGLRQVRELVNRRVDGREHVDVEALLGQAS